MTGPHDNHARLGRLLRESRALFDADVMMDDVRGITPDEQAEIDQMMEIERWRRAFVRPQPGMAERIKLARRSQQHLFWAGLFALIAAMLVVWMVHADPIGGLAQTVMQAQEMGQ